MQRLARSPWKLPLLSGAMLGLGYYVPLLLPNLLAFIPLLYWLDQNPRAGRFGILRAGFLFGLATHLITLHFMYAMLEYSWLAALLYAFFAGALALRVMLAVALLGWLRRRTGLSWGLLLLVVWLPFEWLSTFGDLRMTGDHLAHTLSGYPFLIQFADVVGHYGVSGFMVVVNGLAYEVWLGSTRRRSALALAVLLLVVLVYDGWAWVRPVPDAPTLNVALVQPNIALTTKRESGNEIQQQEELAALTRKAAEAGAELIVWPETARPDPIYHWLDRPETYAMRELSEMAAELDTTLLAGAEYVRIRSRDDYDLHNAAIVINPDGSLETSWAAKHYLVPFVEATPFRKLFGPLVEGKEGEWRWLAGGFKAGPRSAILPAAGARVGVLVCYEQLFPDLSRDLRNAGAEFQVVMTNDAWFGRTVFQRYQANAVRLRAIENRSDFVRVANTGISGFVDRYGRYHEMTKLFESAVETYPVRRSVERTPYDRFGDFIVWITLIGLGVAVAVGLRWPTQTGPV